MALIYIVEDDTDIRTIERLAMSNSGHTVEEFGNGKDFLARVQDRCPDLVILDIMLPDQDGYEILRKIRTNPITMKLPVIMVTAKTAELEMIRGLEIGADDYIRKPFSVMELITRVKALLRRAEVSNGAKQMNLGGLLLDDDRRSVTVNSNTVELTYKEFELLKLLMSSPGIVFSRETILQRVWETDFEGETRTVDMHIKTLRQKLGESGSRIRTVRNVGYVIE